MAVAWAVLHELRHIRHQHEGTGADPHANDAKANHEEEFSCDAFATRFLLEGIDAYGVLTGEAVEQVRRKRQLGIHFGLFAVALLAKDKWAASNSHPSVQSRIDAVRALMVPSSDMATAMAHAAFAALRTIWPGAPRSP
ncbi:phage exclusion protein Lit family protein [Mesorhizobium hawassense]|uniref:phage exclusion protein Lit family protein n=1 Tax=Mesorhizobium hawassense TaxID=1209954 RepID=UPI001FE1064A|nr:phage exclusion protein Lit family protein [Mesorhizobium hawassense]